MLIRYSNSVEILFHASERVCRFHVTKGDKRLIHGVINETLDIVPARTFFENKISFSLIRTRDTRTVNTRSSEYASELNPAKEIKPWKSC